MKTRLLRRLKKEADAQYILLPVKNESMIEIYYFDFGTRMYSGFQNKELFSYRDFDGALKRLRGLRRDYFWTLCNRVLYNRRKKKLRDY